MYRCVAGSSLGGAEISNLNKAVESGYIEKEDF